MIHITKTDHRYCSINFHKTHLHRFPFHPRSRCGRCPSLTLAGRPPCPRAPPSDSSPWRRWCGTCRRRAPCRGRRPARQGWRRPARPPPPPPAPDCPSRRSGSGPAPATDSAAAEPGTPPRPCRSAAGQRRYHSVRVMRSDEL